MISKEDLLQDERYDFGERAAIYEFDAGFSRAEAERRALLDIEARRNRKGQQELNYDK